MALGISERNEINDLQRRVKRLEQVVEELALGEKADAKREAREREERARIEREKQEQARNGAAA